MNQKQGLKVILFNLLLKSFIKSHNTNTLIASQNFGRIKYIKIYKNKKVEKKLKKS